MTRNTQARPKWLPGAIIGFLALLLLAPSAAWAGSRDDYDRTTGHHWSHFGDARHQHASLNHKHHGAYKHKHPGKRRGHHKHVDFYCRPCDRYFSARNGLYDHVAYRHRVPSRYLELAVSFGEFGWIFFGG